MNKHLKQTLAAALASFVVIPGTAFSVAISGQGTWEVTLQPRDLDGDLSTFEAYFDTLLNITWLSTAYTPPEYSGSWEAANAWAANLDFDGIVGWRLPAFIDTGTPGCNFSYFGTDCGYSVDVSTSEMAHMFYVTLGNISLRDTSGGLQEQGSYNDGPFPYISIGADGYWTDTYGFVFVMGYGSSHYSTYPLPHAWAVHDGDVGLAIPSAVPLPSAVWLLSSGLVGLAGIARKKFSK